MEEIMKEKKKKNIVLVQNTEIWWYLALSTFLTWLIQRYDKQDNNYSLICWYIDKEDQIGDSKKNINIHEMWTSYNKIKDNLIFTRKAFKTLINIHKKSPIDIIHCLYPNSSLQSAVLFKTFIKPSVKIIYDVRSPRIEMSFANSRISKSKQRIKHIMHFSEKVMTRLFVNYFVFISQWTEQYYKQTYSLHYHNNTSIIPTWTDVYKFADWRIDNENDYVKKSQLKEKLYWEKVNKYDAIIWYIGTISKMRAMVDYLEHHIREIKHSKIFFVMIGNGDDHKHLLDFIQKHNLEDRFFAPWKMKQSELIEYMHSFDYGRCHLPDIFVFRNSFPLKILEYMSAGIQILASKIKTHNELAKLHPSIHIYNEDENMFDVVTNQNKNTTQSESIESLAKLYDRWSLYMDYLEIYEK